MANQPIELFIFYAQSDWVLMKTLEGALLPFVPEGLLQPWQSWAIDGEFGWTTELETRFQSSALVLVLLSPAFLAVGTEQHPQIHQVKDRMSAGTVRVVPILLKPGNWWGSPFRTLQLLPRDATAIASWPNPAEAFAEITRNLRRVLQSL